MVRVIFIDMKKLHIIFIFRLNIYEPILYLNENKSINISSVTNDKLLKVLNKDSNNNFKKEDLFYYKDYIENIDN